MINSPAIDIARVLDNAGVAEEAIAGSSGWSVFVSKEPTAPDNVVTVYDTGGFDPNPKFLLDYPTVQVRVRANKGDYIGAYTKIIEARDALLGFPPETIGGTDYIGIWSVGNSNSAGMPMSCLFQ